MRRFRLLAPLAVLAVLAAGTGGRASAQGDIGASFPNKPIRFVVGYAAGGATISSRDSWATRSVSFWANRW